MITKPNALTRFKAVKIGEVGVDTGHLIIADPASVQDGIEIESWYTDNLRSRWNDYPPLVSFASGEGDGNYPVYAIVDDEDDLVGVIVWFYDNLPLPYPIADDEKYRKRFPPERQK